MSWTPADISSLCSQNSSLSGCSLSAMTFVHFLTQYFSGSNDNYTASANTKESQSEEYDFIIIGAGSAGCVLANRLSEINDWKILLLEAGGQEPLVADVPSFIFYLQGSNIDWGYTTQPQEKSCRSKPKGMCTWSRGKVMGGSSTINYMVYIRGQHLDFDHWAKLGNSGWDYKNVLPYFKKSERNRIPEIVNADPGFHGTDGYLNVEYFPYEDPNNLIILEALREIGLKDHDPNGKGGIGSSRIQQTGKDGQRHSTNAAYIRPVINERSNLIIKSNAYVTKIIIDHKTKKATGVEYVLTKSGY